MLSRFTEPEIKELVRKVDELQAKLPTLDELFARGRLLFRESSQVESSEAELSTRNH